MVACPSCRSTAQCQCEVTAADASINTGPTASGYALSVQLAGTLNETTNKLTKQAGRLHVAQTALTVTDTPTMDLTAGAAGSGHTGLTAAVKLAPTQSGTPNAVTAVTDGLFMGASGWAALPMVTWANAGGAKYRRDGDVVELSGWVSAASAVAGSVIGTLPAGFRPLATQQFSCACASSGHASIDILATGNVVYRGATNVSFAAAALYLDKVRFSTL